MKLLTADTVEEAVQDLTSKPAFVTILQASEVSADFVGHKLFQACLFHPETLEGKAPHSFNYMEQCTNMPSCFNALNGKQLCRLYEFLNNNGSYRLIPTNQDGDCLFGAFRRCTTLPAECADVHVRRIVVMAMATHPEFFYLLLKRSIASTYGLTRDPPDVLQDKINKGTITPQDLREQRMPGPFSFVAYLRYLLQDSTYGDANVVLVMSMLWQLRITCLIAESLFEIRFRHNQRLSKADMVLVLCQETEHYVAAGKRLRNIRKRSLASRKGLQ